jgi:hypothetical protein
MPNQPEPTHDELPCDFLAFLEQRLGLDERATLDAIGSFLVRYEPSVEARARQAVSTDTRPTRPATRRQSRADVVAAAA